MVDYGHVVVVEHVDTEHLQEVVSISFHTRIQKSLGTISSPVCSSTGPDCRPSGLRRVPFKYVPFELSVSLIKIYAAHGFNRPSVLHEYSGVKRTLPPSAHTSACRLLIVFESNRPFCKVTAVSGIPQYLPTRTRSLGTSGIRLLSNRPFVGERKSAG